jgi:hypothetical protein
VGVQRNKGITFRYRQIRGIGAIAVNPQVRSLNPIEPPAPETFLGPDVLSWGLVDKFETNLTGGEIVHYFKWDENEFTGSDSPLNSAQFRAVLYTTTGSFSASLQVFSASTLLFSLSSSNEIPTTYTRTITTEPNNTIWTIKLSTQNSNARAILGGISIFMSE